MTPTSGKKPNAAPSDPEVISSVGEAANDPSAPYFFDGSFNYTSQPT